MVGLVCTALVLTGCSRQGGKQEQSPDGVTAGQVANTPRLKIAMITHAPPR